MTLSDDAIDRLRHCLDGIEIPGGRYDVRGRLGSGSMGTVWRATDRELGRDVAVKVLNDAFDMDRARAQLEREAKTLAGLEHPSIPPVHDVGRLADGRVFYVMKCVEGTTLAQWVRANPAPAERLRAFLKACDAVAFANERGVVHRDLKPSNLMLGRFGEVLVMDWGIATASELGAREASGRPRDDGGAGTPGYRAPEQISSGPISPRVDVYALGGVLAFLDRGEDPVEGAALEISDRRLRAIVARARSEDPTRRYASVAELAADVRRLLDREPVHAYREWPWERVARVVARNQFFVWLIVGYLVLRICMFAWASSR